MKRLTWNELLSSTTWASVTSGTEPNLEEFAHWRSPRDVAARIVRGDRCASQDALFDEWSAVLQFPLSTPDNWNAFDDDIGDLSWMRSHTVVIFVARAEVLLGQPSADFEIGMLIDIFAKP